MNRAILVVLVVVAIYGVQASAATAVTGEVGSAMSADAGGEAPLLIDAGAVSGIATGDDGDLLVDAGSGGSAGINPGARVTYGDPGAPADHPAFSVTNPASERRVVTMTYAGVDAADPGANVRFEFADRSGARVGTVTEESGPVSIPVGGGETLFALVVVDTHGLSSADDLSGTLSIRTTGEQGDR